MNKSLKKEIKSRIKELESTHSKLTGSWMDADPERDADIKIGRSLDFINKAIEKLKSSINE